MADLTDFRVEIALSDPELTPILRAGLGGLAASIQALDPSVLLPGSAEVLPDRVVLGWPKGGGAGFMKQLFEHSFCIDADGMIDLPGSRGVPLPIAVRAAVQDALRQTFLQHGKAASKSKAGGRLHTFQVDDRTLTVAYDTYTSFAHQGEAAAIAASLEAGPSGVVRLAGWANPGAARRHTQYAATEVDYTGKQALCACFAIAGCASFKRPGGGVLVVPEPLDLSKFRDARKRITPERFAAATVAGVGDALLQVELDAVSNESGRHARSIATWTGYSLRTTPWVSGGQKTRAAAATVGTISAEVRATYRAVRECCPPRVRAVKGKKGADEGCFTIPSALRAFVAENLAAGRPWYRGFATARGLGNNSDRFLHTRYAAKNKGALTPEEPEALRRMSDHLHEREKTLVRAVHEAMLHRFAQIAEENQTNAAARRNRMNREAERWRLALSGAKTREQTRFALADLFARAGKVEALQLGWENLLPLLQDDWQSARDLGLVALASYKAQKRELDPTAVSDDTEETEPPENP